MLTVSDRTLRRIVGAGRTLKTMKERTVDMEGAGVGLWSS